MHAHVHKEFFRNQDVSPSPRLFFSFCLLLRGVASVSGAVIYHPPPGVATGGGGKKSCRAKTIISARAKLELSSFSLSFFLSLSPPFSPPPPSSSPLHLASLSALFYVSRLFHRFRGREEARSAGETSLWNPSSLGFQGLLLAAFNERKDKTYPPLARHPISRKSFVRFRNSRGPLSRLPHESSAR